MGLKVIIKLVSKYFQNKANVIAYNVRLNITAKGLPIVFQDNQLSCFVNSEVTCLWIIIVLANQRSHNNFQHVRQALVAQYFIRVFFPAIFQALFPDFPHPPVFYIQLQQSQPKLPNTSLLIGSFVNQLTSELGLELAQPWQDVCPTDQNLVEQQEGHY